MEIILRKIKVITKNFTFITLLCLISSFSINAQTIITDRPDQTESSSTVIKNSFQIETGILIGFSEENGFTNQQILVPTTLFRYGLTKGFEIRVLSQFENIKNELESKAVSGISDIELGAKIQLFKKDSVNTEVAFLSHAILPSGSKKLSNNKLGIINKLSISHSINESIGIGYNLGYNYFGYGKGDFTYSLAFGFGITNTLGLYFEPYGEVVEFDNHQASFDTGFTYLIKDNSQLDFSFGTGLNYNMNYISIGYSINII